MDDLRDILAKKLKKEVLYASELKKIERIPTGIAGVDAILGGGLPKGRIIQIWGAESVGKSSLCLSIIKEIQMREPESRFLYIDCEGTVNIDDIKAIELDAKRLLFMNDIYGGEEVIDSALLGLENGIKVAIIDSVAYLRPKKVLEEIQKDSAYRDVSGIANLLERAQQKLTRTVEQSEGCLIFINQERPSQGMYKAPTHPGGSALKFMLSCSVHITGISRDRDNPNNFIQHLFVRKNKTFTPMLKADIPVLNRIIQKGQALLLVLQQYELVKAKGGGNYELEESVAKDLGVSAKLGRGAEKVGVKLEQDQKLYNLLYNKMLVSIQEKSTPQGEIRVEEGVTVYEEDV